MSSLIYILVVGWAYSLSAVAVVQDLSVNIEDRDAPILQVWPDPTKRPSKAQKQCQSDLLELTKIPVLREEQFAVQFSNFCALNEYRMSIYTGCVRRLSERLAAREPEMSPIYCGRAHSFSLNDYDNYIECGDRVASNTVMTVGQIGSFCERSRGKKIVVDCLLSRFTSDSLESTSSPVYVSAIEACLANNP